MTVVNHDTGELVETIGVEEARRLTTEAQNEFRSSREHFDRAWSLIERAVEGGGHVDLGYRSPGEYLHTEFDGVLSGLNVADRRVAVKTMTDWGLSSRAIAPALGVTDRQVRRDAAATGGTDVPPDEPPMVEVPASFAEIYDNYVADDAEGGDLMEDIAATPVPKVPIATVTGIDGKKYKRPTPPPKPERSGEQQNAEENSQTLTRSLIFLLAFQHPNQRDTARKQWDMGHQAVSPSSRAYVTPDQMRTAAEGLARLADEWETHHA